MSSSFDLIIKNGKCFVDGQLKKVDIGISNEIVKKIGKESVLCFASNFPERPHLLTVLPSETKDNKILRLKQKLSCPKAL